MHSSYRIFLALLAMLTMACMTTAQAAPKDPMYQVTDGGWYWAPSEPKYNATIEPCYFRKAYALKAPLPVKARIGVSVDNEAEVWVNGKLLGSTLGWNILQVWDISPQVADNLCVAVKGTNGTEGSNPAGLYVRLVLEWANGKTQVLQIDPTWRVSKTLTDGWQNPGFNDKSWGSVMYLDPVGKGAWGEHAWMGIGWPTEPDDSFITTTVPGLEKQFDAMRNLYWSNMRQPYGAKYASIWYAWMVAPSMAPVNKYKGEDIRTQKSFAQAFDELKLDAQGVVSMQQHFSYAHPQGWPFPMWFQSAVKDAYGPALGWHFQNGDDNVLAGIYKGFWDLAKDIGQTGDKAVAQWELTGASSAGIKQALWSIDQVKGKQPVLTSIPKLAIETGCAPFMQIRFESSPKTRPGEKITVQWQRTSDADWSSERAVTVDADMPHAWDAKSPLRMCLTEMYTHPQWTGTIKALRVVLPKGHNYRMESIFTTFDTRHPITNITSVMGMVEYLRWSGDTAFLKARIGKIRQYALTPMRHLGGLKEGVINVPWVGHDGRSGITYKDGKLLAVNHGLGIGNNYWDLLPFGGKDCYATAYYYAMLASMCELEQAIADHPEWGIAPPARELKPQALRKHMVQVQTTANSIFWNPKAQRFIATIDKDGVKHDYGYTFLNTEAIALGLATRQHAKQIYQWMDGQHIVPGETSTGADIYHWRFGARASTIKNDGWYVWPWHGFVVPWGRQVQDGGAVLGFSYFDVLGRQMALGADNAGKRYETILNWYQDVQQAGGFREYYKDGRDGATLQGGGPPGGLGFDVEFTETMMVPYAPLRVFAGFQPTVEGVRITPALPASWPQIELKGVRYREGEFTLTVSNRRIVMSAVKGAKGSIRIQLPGSGWSASLLQRGKRSQPVVRSSALGSELQVALPDGCELTLTR